MGRYVVEVEVVVEAANAAHAEAVVRAALARVIGRRPPGAIRSVEVGAAFIEVEH